MEFEFVKLSSKGQIVIPASMRHDFKEGDKLILIRNEDKIILEKASALSEKLKEDLEFARRTEEAWKQIEQGKCKTMEFDKFIKEMKKW